MKKGRFLGIYTGIVIAYLFIPIAVMALFGFNDPQGRFNFEWQGFTLKHWENPGGPEGLLDAMQTSIEIAAITAVVATALGAERRALAAQLRDRRPRRRVRAGRRRSIRAGCRACPIGSHARPIARKCRARAFGPAA